MTELPVPQITCCGVESPQYIVSEPFAVVKIVVPESIHEKWYEEDRRSLRVLFLN